jgi:hypothetical protein
MKARRRPETPAPALGALPKLSGNPAERRRSRFYVPRPAGDRRATIGRTGYDWRSRP